MNREKGLTLCVIAALLIENGSRYLKKDNIFYKGNVKRMLNNLVDENATIIYNIEKLKNLIQQDDFVKQVSDEIKEEVDSEILLDGLNMEQRIFFNLINHFYHCDNSGLFHLDMYLDNIANNRKLYTQEEVDILLKQNK
jgi:hypothetical protein